MFACIVFLVGTSARLGEVLRFALQAVCTGDAKHDGARARVVALGTTEQGARALCCPVLRIRKMALWARAGRSVLRIHVWFGLVSGISALRHVSICVCEYECECESESDSVSVSVSVGESVSVSV